MVMVVNAIPILNLDDNEIDEPLGRVLNIADELERTLTGKDAY